MTGKTHVLCTTAAFAAFTVTHPGMFEFVGNTISPIMALPGVAVGAFLPDIDIHQSRLGQKFKIVSGMLGHRGITHTLLVPAILLLSIGISHSKGANVVMSLVLGYLVGLLFDKRRSKKKGNLIWTFRNIVSSIRGLILGIVLVALSIMSVNVWGSCAFGLAVGWLGHIFEDLFNYKGCPIMWPISNKHVHVMSVKTRHWTEAVFLFVWLVGCALWVLLRMVGR